MTTFNLHNTNLFLSLNKIFMENWKDIKGYEGLYQISNQGKVKGLDRVLQYNATKTKIWKGKTIKTIVDGLGYCRVSLCKDGVKKAHKIHRLVSDMFLIGEGPINHIDGNKLNNNISNLEHCTNSENINHAYLNGLKPKKTRRKIICKETNEIFYGPVALSRELKLSSVYVGSHLKGNTKQIKGLTYKYID